MADNNIFNNDSANYITQDLDNFAKSLSSSNLNLDNSLTKLINSVSDIADTIQKLDELKTDEQRLQEEINKSKKEASDKEKEINALKLAQEQTDNEKVKQTLADKQDKAQKELDALNIHINALKGINEEENAQYQIEVAQHELKKQQLEKTKTFVTEFSSKLDQGVKILTDTFSNAVNNVVNAYQQQAGKLSAMLGTSVEDVSKLQRTVASQLRESSLSGSISNVAVLSEASSLASSGYTNVDKLQQNAVDIAIGKEIAPNLDFNNATVKNLINIFGSDFTTKFSAIAEATQESAGSTIGVKENLSNLMTNLEPVYMNNKYQLDALQGTSEVTATLAAARDQGIIDESQMAEYRSMLIELMDPSKALKSSNIAVRQAAVTYDWSSNSPADALAAILGSTSSLYSNVSSGDSSSDRLSRSLYASVMGQNTMSATYNPRGYTDVNMLTTGSLESTYKSQLAKLQSGDFTTREDEIKNRTENASVTQNIAVFAESFPKIYKATAGTVIATLNSLPSRIGKSINKNLLSSEGGSGGSIGSEIKGLKDALSSSTGGLKGKIGTINTALGGRTGALAQGSYMAGIAGLVNVGSSVADRGFNIQGLTMGGDKLSSVLSYAGMGAALGTVFGGGPVGTLIGGALGGGVGYLMALGANKEATEEQTKAIKEQTKATTDVVGSFNKLDSFQAQIANASGKGTIDLTGGTAEIDMDVPKAAYGMSYVPYDDYLVKLHKGEAVVTANAANQYRKINPSFYNSINNDNSTVVETLEKQTDSIVNAIKGDEDFSMVSMPTMKTYNISNAMA